MRGIEPPLEACKATALPLYYTPIVLYTILSILSTVFSSPGKKVASILYFSRAKRTLLSIVLAPSSSLRPSVNLTDALSRFGFVPHHSRPCYGFHLGYPHISDLSPA